MGGCPECGNFTSFSFVDDVKKLPVYRCDSIGVPVTDERGRVVGHTTDHQDHYYMEDKRVEPVRIGGAWVARGRRFPWRHSSPATRP